jgi:hypothetical protein
VVQLLLFTFVINLTKLFPFDSGRTEPKMLASRLLRGSSTASLQNTTRSAANASGLYRPNLERMIPKHLLRNPKQSLSVEGEEALIKINSSIVAYLENASKHKHFMSEKKAEFELGKRHLANIMGWNPETLTQSDINVSISSSLSLSVPISTHNLICRFWLASNQLPVSFRIV